MSSIEPFVEPCSGHLSRVDGWLRHAVISRLEKIRGGVIQLYEGGDTLTVGDPGLHPSPIRVSVRVLGSEFYRWTALRGSVGTAEAYMEGFWECDDLTALIRLMLRNRAMVDAMEKGTAWWTGTLLKAWHAVNRNNHRGSRRNIAAHYDLGNDFFRCFLDENLMYSSAIYPSARTTLTEASHYKLHRICRKLELSPTDHLLEIGSGWGGLAIYAAEHFGCRVTTATISREQFRYASREVLRRGLAGQVEVLLCDYRDLTGQYDKLVSIEMVEAVGHHYLNRYFEKCAELLKDDGLMLLQAITIEDYRYEAALESVDFIKRYIFPGSFIPSASVLMQASAQNTKLRLINLEDIGLSYARTLRDWRRRFFENLQDIRALGFDERFIRMWEFYLCYCEGGFLERTIGNAQMLFANPGNVTAQWLPGATHEST